MTEEGERSAAIKMRREEERLISATNARALLDSERKVKFIDVRQPEEYGKLHIRGAVNIYAIFMYLAKSDHDGVRQLKSTFEDLFRRAGVCGDEHIIVYEKSLQSLLNGASCRGYYLLKLLGHPSVSILAEGFDGWVKLGYPTSSQPEPVIQGTFQASWTPSIWSGSEDVVKALQEGDIKIVDVRDDEEWTGARSSPYGIDPTPRTGRIPGAIHILWTDLMETREDGLAYFRRPEDIRDRCAAKGVTPDQKIIVYCFKGSRSSNSYVALKEAGFENVTNYLASWNEWSRDPDLAIDSETL